MALPNELISQFAKLAKGEDKSKNDNTVFGTIVEYNGSKYMRIDGSDQLTPISSTTNVEADERVTGTIKNHSLIVTGNLSSPAARTTEVEIVGGKISEFEVIVADKVSTSDLAAANGRIDNLVSENVTIRGELTANAADITDLKADNVTINDKLSAQEGYIQDLEAENVEITGKLEAADADIKSIQADNVVIRNSLSANEAEINDLKAENVEISGQLTAQSADIETLKTDKLSATDADLKYANIDFSNIGKAAMEYFYAESGLIKDVTVGDQTITGNLVGVTISGDLIEGNTIVAEKLVIKGDDGLYYKLNTDGVTTEAEQTDYNSLNGSVIKAKSVTAEKISVKDLVAFDATIGGFNITENSIYSDVKETVDNTTRGIYMDTDGQMAIGDSTNYLKFFKDTDDTYKLEISAATLKFGSSQKTVETVIQEAVDSVEVGGRNLLLDSEHGLSRTRTSVGTGANSYGAEEELSDAYLDILKSGGEVTLSCYIELTNARLSYIGFDKNLFISGLTIDKCGYTSSSSNTKVNYSGRISVTGTVAKNASATEVSTNKLRLVLENFIVGTVKVSKLKLEKGNKATDWTPAPEDVEKDIEAVETSINNAQLEIDTLNANISTLVTGSEGETLMTQTDTGWTFNMANLQDTLNTLSSDVANLNTGTESTQSEIDNLKRSVTDLGAYTDYIDFVVENGKPTIVLGETDSDFKVKINNLGVRMMEGSVVPASITNQALNIEKAIVNGELQQGGFAWINRPNGHYSLIWKDDE